MPSEVPSTSPTFFFCRQTGAQAASFSASSIAKWANRAIRESSRYRSAYSRWAAESRISPASTLRRCSWRKLATGLMPVLPARSPSHNWAVFSPSALTLPRPATRTLGRQTPLSEVSPTAFRDHGLAAPGGDLGEDEAAQPVQGPQILARGLVAADLDPVFFLEDRDELDQAHRVDAEIAGQGVLQLDLAHGNGHKKILDEDLLQLLYDRFLVGHGVFLTFGLMAHSGSGCFRRAPICFAGLPLKW